MQGSQSVVVDRLNIGATIEQHFNLGQIADEGRRVQGGVMPTRSLLLTSAPCAISNSAVFGRP